jgi:hypothetical protein
MVTSAQVPKVVPYIKHAAEYDFIETVFVLKKSDERKKYDMERAFPGSRFFDEGEKITFKYVLPKGEHDITIACFAIEYKSPTAKPDTIHINHKVTTLDRYGFTLTVDSTCAVKFAGKLDGSTSRKKVINKSLTL